VAPPCALGFSAAFLVSVEGSKARTIFFRRYCLDFFRGWSRKRSTSPISINAETPPRKKLPAQATRFMMFLL
jgi:hypothetical protein